MNAVLLDAPGGPEALRFGEVPTPTPRGDEVLIKTRVASLNPIDTYIRAGVVKMALPMPFITGTDFAGTVSAVGPDVKHLRVGDRVWGSNQGLLGRQGTCAEYVCTSEQWVYPAPPGVEEEQLAGVALVGITAHLGLFHFGRLKTGETVFVNGGTGGVGSLVAQCAKAVGAKVITTVGSADKAALCKSWGVDVVLNYKSDDVPARVKDVTGGHGVDVWYETQREPDFIKTFELLARRGRMIVMAGRTAQPTFPVGAFYTRDLSLFGFAMFNASPAEQLGCATDLARWLGEKKIQVPIGKRFPLGQTAEAHRFLEANTLHKAGTLTGKVVITL